MKIQVLAVGVTRAEFVRVGLREYLGRLKGPRALEWVEIKAESGDSPQARGREAERLLARIPRDGWVVLLDEHGESLGSEALAQRIGGARRDGTRALSFVVGGAYGLDPSVASRARFTLSLSRMTFPHELVRLMLVEQIYRAIQILDGTGYHHGEPALAPASVGGARVRGQGRGGDRRR